MDRYKKEVSVWETDLSLLRPTATTPNVSNTNDVQTLRSYVDEQREQMQQILGGTQEDYNRLACAFDKSTMTNFHCTMLSLKKTHKIHRL